MDSCWSASIAQARPTSAPSHTCAACTCARRRSKGLRQLTKQTCDRVARIDVPGEIKSSQRVQRRRARALRREPSAAEHIESYFGCASEGARSPAYGGGGHLRRFSLRQSLASSLLPQTAHLYS